MGGEVYRQLCETMAKRGGRYPGMEIPEFYELVHELFTPEERQGIPVPPVDQKALREAIIASQAK